MRYLKKLYNLNSRGDTIVEVMIVLAVLSLAFSVTTATATRSLSSSHTAQEHSQAQSLLDQQLELLRQSIDQGVDYSTHTQFCLPDSADLTKIRDIVTVGQLDTGSYGTECNPSGDFYFQSIEKISPVGAQQYYDLKVLWEGAGNRGVQKVETFYRVQPRTANLNSGIIINSASPSITVYVNKARTDAEDTTTDPNPPVLACRGPSAPPALGDLTKVELDEVDALGNTIALVEIRDIGSSSTFMDPPHSSSPKIKDNSFYRAKIIDPGGVPTTTIGHFTICPPNPSPTPLGQLIDPVASSPSITLTINPFCTQTKDHKYHGGYYADGDPGYPANGQGGSHDTSQSPDSASDLQHPRDTASSGNQYFADGSGWHDDLPPNYSVGLYNDAAGTMGPGREYVSSGHYDTNPPYNGNPTYDAGGTYTRWWGHEGGLRYAHNNTSYTPIYGSDRTTAHPPANEGDLSYSDVPTQGAHTCVGIADHTSHTHCWEYDTWTGHVSYAANMQPSPWVDTSHETQHRYYHNYHHKYDHYWFGLTYECPH